MEAAHGLFHRKKLCKLTRQSEKLRHNEQTSHLRKNEDKACSKNRRGRSYANPLGDSKGLFRTMEEAGKKGKEGFPSSVL